MAMTKQRRTQNNSVDFGGFGTVNQFGNFEVNKLSAPDTSTFAHTQVVMNEHDINRLPEIGVNNIQVMDTNKNAQSV